MPELRFASRNTVRVLDAQYAPSSPSQDGVKMGRVGVLSDPNGQPLHPTSVARRGFDRDPKLCASAGSSAIDKGKKKKKNRSIAPLFTWYITTCHTLRESFLAPIPLSPNTMHAPLVLPCCTLPSMK